MTAERALKERQWLLCCVVLVFVLASAGATEAGRKHHEERYSTLHGQTIQLHPSEVTMQVPDLWAAGYKTGGRPNMYLTRDELRHAGVTTFLSVIAEDVLNSKDCAFEAENLSPIFWLGVYIVDQPTDAVIRRIYEKGRKAPARYTQGSTAMVFPVKKEGTWEHVRILVNWWFGDYGMSQAVDFYVEPLPNEQTMVFVTSFNGTGELRLGWEDDPEVMKLRNRLLESVVVPKAFQNLPPQ